MSKCIPWIIWNHDANGLQSRDGAQVTDIKTGCGMIRVMQSVGPLTFPEMTGRVKFIVRAVNAHDDLLEALRTAAIIMVNTKEKAHKSARLCAIDAAERAIAKGEGRD